MIGCDIMKFSTEQELYNRVLPALNSKISELERQSINNITPKDIWKLLKETKWMSAKDLTLADIVSDIINLKIDVIISYYQDIEEVI